MALPPQERAEGRLPMDSHRPAAPSLWSGLSSRRTGGPTVKPEKVGRKGAPSVDRLHFSSPPGRVLQDGQSESSFQASSGTRLRSSPPFGPHHQQQQFPGQRARRKRWVSREWGNPWQISHHGLDGLLVMPYPHRLVLAPAGYPLSVGGPVDSVHLVAVPREIDGQFVRGHGPNLESGIFRCRHKQPRIGREGALIDRCNMAAQRADKLPVPVTSKSAWHLATEAELHTLHSRSWYGYPTLRWQSIGCPAKTTHG